MKIIKKVIHALISFEPLIVWLRYFKTVKSYNLVTNTGVPLVTCILLWIFRSEEIVSVEFDTFSISAILVGFCSSILIMLFTIEGKNIEKLKQTALNDNKKSLSLHEALIYKFAFIVINLLVMIFVGILAFYIGFKSCHVYILYTLFILLNTIFTLIEALTNVIFCLIKPFK